jgi:hypothetical protein
MFPATYPEAIRVDSKIKWFIESSKKIKQNMWNIFVSIVYKDGNQNVLSEREN